MTIGHYSAASAPSGSLIRHSFLRLLALMQIRHPKIRISGAAGTQPNMAAWACFQEAAAREAQHYSHVSAVYMADGLLRPLLFRRHAITRRGVLITALIDPASALQPRKSVSGVMIYAPYALSLWFL